MWTPVKEESINKYVEYCDNILFDKPDCLRFWEYIKIKPEKWIEKTIGKESGGFWVVGIFGKKVIYYNDIEEGYNMSTYKTYGEIDEYNCSQIELHELIQNLFNEIENRRK